jgi:16S rRNA (guanine527-N7)-methyltransferase
MMNNWQQKLLSGAADLGLALTDRELERFTRYLDLMLERNLHINLTAITDPLEVATKHFVDSLAIETVWHPQPGEQVIDIGTGAGLPGIPLAIRHPEVSVVLNDSVRKKVTFLEDVIVALGLDNTRAIWARAEEVGRDDGQRGKYDIVTVRAVAHLGTLIEYSLPLLKVNGQLIAMKGPTGAAEIAEAAPALIEVGGEVVGTHRLHIDGAGDRLFIRVQKTRATPKQFPREPGGAKKKPLYLDSRRGTP